MIQGNTYTTLRGTAIDLTALDADERRLVDELVDRQKAGMEWPAYANYYMTTVGKFYHPRGLTPRQITTTLVWKIAQDLKSRLMVAAGDALPPGPDYRDALGELIRSEFPTQKAFCEATGLSEDLVSHVLSKRKHLAIDTLTGALSRIGYRLQITATEKA